MKKFLSLGLPVTVIIIFILVMLSNYYYINKDNEIELYIETIEENILSHNWYTAHENTLLLIDSWNTLQTKIQFSIEKNILFDFEDCLYRLKGAVYQKDSNASYIELTQLKHIWEQM